MLTSLLIYLRIVTAFNIPTRFIGHATVCKRLQGSLDTGQWR